MIAEGLLYDLARTMFAVDVQGRLTGRAPHLHLLRTGDAVIARCHASVPEPVARRLIELAHAPRGRPSQWASDYALYLEAMASIGQPRAVRAGPLYAFPAQPEPGLDTVTISAANRDLLRHGLDEWLLDVDAGLLMTAVVRDGRARSVCASVNASKSAHCAGVKTLPEHRGQGFAVKAVASWAHAVQTLGVAPFYGTTFDNLASQGVARRLGLTLVGSEFSIECATA